MHYVLFNWLVRAFNPFNAELNPICHLLALLGAHHILHVSWIRVTHIYFFLIITHIFYLKSYL
jgi:hypothetical protein